MISPFTERIPSNEGLTLKTPAFESLHGGKFTLSTQLIKPNYPLIDGHDSSALATDVKKSN